MRPRRVFLIENNRNVPLERKGDVRDMADYRIEAVLMADDAGALELVNEADL